MNPVRFTDNRLLRIRNLGDYFWYSFYCPGCGLNHTIEVGKPTSWTFDGNEQSPTFSPSVLVTGVRDAEFDPKPTRCHTFVRSGMIQFLNDCTHLLAGQTVVMVPIPKRLDEL